MSKLKPQTKKGPVLMSSVFGGKKFGFQPRPGSKGITPKQSGSGFDAGRFKTQHKG